MAACLAFLAGTATWAHAQSPASNLPAGAPAQSRIVRLQNPQDGIGTAGISRHSAPAGTPIAFSKAPRRTIPAGLSPTRELRPLVRNRNSNANRPANPGATPATVSGNWTAATRFGSSTATSYENGQCIHTDASGNVYMALQFEGTIEVDAQTFTAADVDILLLSYSPAGTLRWGRKIGGASTDLPAGISSSADGNIFLAGSSAGSINFGNGVSYTKPANSGASTIFVLKLSSSTGAPTWVKNVFGTEANSYIQTYDIATDVNGNPVLVGTCRAGLTAGAAAFDSNFDAFVMSFSGTTGVNTARWMYRVTQTVTDSSAAFTTVAINSDNRIFCAGSFTGTVDFDPTQGLLLNSSGLGDGLLLYINADGAWQNARRISTTADDAMTDITIDNAQNPLVVGYFGAAMTIGTVTVPNAGGPDVILFELDTVVDLLSVGNAGGTGDDEALAVTVDNSNVAHIGGVYESTVAFGTQNGTSEGSWDGFIWSINWTTGATTALATCGGTGDDLVTDLRPAGAALYAMGGFTQHINFTASLALDSRISGTNQADAFMARIGGNCTFSPTFSIQANGAPCLGNTISLSATGVPAGSSYKWTGPNGFSSTATSPQIDLTATSTGQYSLVLTNAGNCSSPAQIVTVTVQTVAAPTVPNVTRCGAGAVTLVPTGAGVGGKYRYYAQANGGTPFDSSASGAQYILASVSGTTSYFVSMVSLAGCEGPRTQVTINISQPITASIIPGTTDTTLCSGSTLILTAQPAGQTYRWSNNQTSQSITVTATGNYSVTVGTLPACTSASAAVQVQVLPRPTSGFSYPTTQFCAGSSNPSPIVTGTPGGSFRSSSPNLAVNAVTGTIDLANSQPGNYFVMYRVGTACKDSTQRDIVIKAAPQATFTYSAAAFCQGPNSAAITLNTGSQSGLFQAIPATGLSLNTTTGAINLATSQAGTYRVYNLIASTPGCNAAKDSFSVTVNPTPTISITAVPSATVCEGERVVLKATTSTPSTISWTPNGAGDSVVVTTGATYQATATLGACQGSSQQVAVSFTARPVQPTLNQTAVGGGVILTASSATPGVSYNWYFNGGIITTTHAPQLPLFDPSQTGAYSVEAVLQGCASSVTTPIIVVITSVRSGKLAGLKVYPNPASSRLTVELPTGTRNGQALILSAEGKQVRLTAALSSGANRLDVSALPKGLYLLKIVTAEGTSQQSIVVE